MQRWFVPTLNENRAWRTNPCSPQHTQLLRSFAHDDQQLRTLCSRAFSTCPQVLVEKSLKGWKEVEYEVGRADCCLRLLIRTRSPHAYPASYRLH